MVLDKVQMNVDNGIMQKSFVDISMLDIILNMHGIIAYSVLLFFFFRIPSCFPHFLSFFLPYLTQLSLSFFFTDPAANTDHTLSPQTVSLQKYNGHAEQIRGMEEGFIFTNHIF